MQNTPHNIDEKQMLRFLLGESSPEEFRNMQAWLEHDTANRQLLEQYETLWAEAGKLTPYPIPVDTPKAWSDFSEKIDQYETQKASKYRTIFTKQNYWGGAIAAALIIGVLITIFIKDPLPKYKSTYLAQTAVLKDTLPDGSTITLNKGTQLRVERSFSKRERRVKLEGEAYFQVSPNKQKPFIVQTTQGYIEVVGTAFRIKTKKDSATEVQVTEGKVRLFTINAKHDTTAILLTKGQSGRVNHGQLPEILTKVESDALAWMRHTFIFENTELEKVFRMLEKHYQVQIKVVNPEIKNCRLSTTFTNQNLNEILEVIATTFDLTYTKKEKNFEVNGNGCE